MHDLGLIPKIQNGVKGFKVLLGGGLGAQPHLAITLRSFLPVEELAPFAEAIVRVFDKYGERNRRNKARFKFLLQSLGEDYIKEKLKKNIFTAQPNGMLRMLPNIKMTLLLKRFKELKILMHLKDGKKQMF